MDEAFKPELPETRPGESGRPGRPRPPYTDVNDNAVQGNKPVMVTVLPSLEAGDNNNINNINQDRGQSVDGPAYKEEGVKVTEKLHLGEGPTALGRFERFSTHYQVVASHICQFDQ